MKKDTITLHCNFCNTDNEINEDYVDALVYEGKIHLEFGCSNCPRVFADCHVSADTIVLKDARDAN